LIGFTVIGISLTQFQRQKSTRVAKSGSRGKGRHWASRRCLPRLNDMCWDRTYRWLEPSSQAHVEEGNSLEAQESPMAAKDLSALFLDTLKDIYYAEKQIYKALPKMAKAADSDQLRAAFEKHHDETEGQIERLEQIFELLGKPARGKKCDAIEGILDEGTEIMEEYKGEPALDAGLLAAAQAVEHYEISRYGTLKTWAGRLSMKDAVKLLDQTLAEEKKTDDALTKLADTAVNAEAA
jgi:ferritin-like metal-binding protein YciE